MTHSLRAVLLAFASGAAVLALVSCNQGGQSGSGEAPSAPTETLGGAPMTADITPMAPATVDKMAEEQAIRDLNNQWLQALNNKDALASANMYAEDGAILPPNAPMASGHDAILSTWTSLLATPGLSINFAPTKIIVADAGDLAIDIGTYTSTIASSDPATAPTTEDGKYVVTWVKRDGEWKVLADMFSSDAPSAAVASAAGEMPLAPDSEMAPGAPASPTAPIEEFAPGTPGDSMAPTTPPTAAEPAPDEGSSMAPAPDATTPPAPASP